METWAFVAIFALAGFLVIAYGMEHEGLSLAFAVAGFTTIGLGSLVLVKRIRKLIEKI